MRHRQKESSSWFVGMMKFWFWWTVVLPVFVAVATVAGVLVWAAVSAWLETQ